jgi:hypothetical protein
MSLFYTITVCQNALQRQCMRSLVYRCGPDPEYSGLAPGAHVAFQMFLTGYLNKVTGFWDIGQHG